MSRVLVTGSRGFIGQRVMALLEANGHEPVGADLDHSVLSDGFASDADVAIHLAAQKYAGHAEEHPEDVAHLNIVGTGNVVRAVPRVILASTCKAASPITAYGASKLIAERIVLNAGGTVIRLVNVLGSTGSVLDIWGRVPKDRPLPVTDTQRMFITPDQAASLFVKALELPPGRYAPARVESCTLAELARQVYPGRPIVPLPLRRGDRPVERLTNEYERRVRVHGDDDVVRIVDCWERGEVWAQQVAA
jgi:FlaA1/EpsC-like NDP-sugar epimerase